MAEGWSSAAADDALETLTGAHRWIQLHTGAPGAAGTANVATESTRLQATWGSAGAGSAGFRQVASSAAIEWEDVAGAEDYTHWSAWSAETDGDFGFSAAMTANAVSIGDNFRVGSGGLVVTLPIATT